MDKTGEKKVTDTCFKFSQYARLSAAIRPENVVNPLLKVVKEFLSAELAVNKYTTP